MVDSVDRLVAGFRGFRARYYEQRPERMTELAAYGQAPEVMVVACADSRVDPGLLLGAEPGEVFTVRNVANLVPPYAPDAAMHGTSAALEFAVRDLGVKHLVVLGHSACGGIKALRSAMSGKVSEREFMAPWMAIVAEACGCGEGGEMPGQAEVEHEGIRISLKNLHTFPWIAGKVATGELTLHGWWVDLNAGRLCAVSPDSDEVRELVAGVEPPNAA